LKKNLPIQVPGQRRLAISRLRVPNLDSVVTAAARNLLSIGAPRHRVYTVFVRSQYTNQQKPGGKTWGKNLRVRVPSQRRLALISAFRAHRPDLHRLVIDAAGQLASLAPCRCLHIKIVKSQHTNQQEQKEGKLEKNLLI